jgi:hypothetical protein
MRIHFAEIARDLAATLVALALVIASGGGAAAQASFTGRVEVTGSVPMTHVVLQLDDGSALRLVGELERELRRLAGIVVAVTGEPTADFPGDALRVESYRVVSVDGHPVLVGILRARDGGLELETKCRSYTIPAPGALAEHAGAKVWIAGDVHHGALTVQSFGVIRPG